MKKAINKLLKAILRKLPDRLYICAIYFLTYFRLPNLKKPRYWSEKMQWKKLYDRRPVLSLVADKVRARTYATGLLGVDITPRLVWCGKRPEDIPFDQLPEGFVIKTNHGFGTNVIVRDKHQLDIPRVVSQLRAWLDTDFSYLDKEWAYKDIDRLVFVEELLVNGNGEIPRDVKLFVFNGQVKAIVITMNRFDANHLSIMLDENFERFPYKGLYKRTEVRPEKPKMLNVMTQYALLLAQGFDALRVDFYDLGDQIFLGELTNYHFAGFPRVPRKLDEYLGRQWVLPQEQQIRVNPDKQHQPGW